MTTLKEIPRAPLRACRRQARATHRRELKFKLSLLCWVEGLGEFGGFRGLGVGRRYWTQNFDQRLESEAFGADVLGLLTVIGLQALGLQA